MKHQRLEIRRAVKRPVVQELAARKLRVPPVDIAP
jgi:hypothetical protein